MAKKPLPEGGQLVNIVCNAHRRPSRLHVFVRSVVEGETQSGWSEFPTTYPPAEALVDDVSREARYSFDPASFDLERKRLTYSFRCTRCGAGPLVIRGENLHPLLTATWDSGNTRLALQELDAILSS